MTPLQIFTYTLTAPGTVPSRQDAPHPHEALLDPTGRYILVNDLGADLVRIYLIDPAGSNNLTSQTPLKAKAGSGPRHGAFSQDLINGSYVYYLGAEISSTVTAYKVSYASGISFEEIGVYSSLAPGEVVPATTTGESTGVVAEVAVSVCDSASAPSHRTAWLLFWQRVHLLLALPSRCIGSVSVRSCCSKTDNCVPQPDGSTLLVSNRRDLTFNNTSPPSDSISTFAISPDDGTLSFFQIFPAGGSYPRQFALNQAGNLAAVGLQQTGIVTILERDATSGAFEKEVASIAIDGGQVVCVVWDE